MYWNISSIHVPTESLLIYIETDNMLYFIFQLNPSEKITIVDLIRQYFFKLH